MACGFLGPGGARRLALEHAVVDQFPVGRLGAGGVADRAVVDAEGGGAHPQFGGGGLEQHVAHLGAGVAQRCAAVLDRLTAGRHAFVGREGGVAGNHFDALQVDVKFVGDDLCQRRGDALAQLDLAGEHGDRAIGVDRQPAVEHAVVLQAAWQLRTRGLLRRGLIDRRKREGDRESRAGLQKAAARRIAGDTAVHVIALAARLMARTMRLCVPQRHRLPASASTMSASVGLGVTSSRALACMIMPAVQ